ncbi:MAG TPA: hypothetical protein VGK71_09475 [Nitrospirota bacterium]|jgi:hypothetical protein
MKIAAVALLLLLGCSTSAFAEEIHKTGIFSNLYYHEEAGDLLGEEVFIVLADEDYYAVYQIAEGGPEVPIVSKVKIEGDIVEFARPKKYGGIFKGRYTAKGIELEKENVAGKILWRRGSYWQ